MQFSGDIQLGSKRFIFVRSRQREGLAIYRGKGVYLRVAKKPIIDHELKTYKSLSSFGFPIPKLMEKGRVNNLSYFTEKSLGDYCFSDLFAQSIKQKGTIADAVFEQFIRVTKKFATAQLKTIRKVREQEMFRKGIHLDLITRELPHYKKSILAFWKEAEKNLQPFPFVISHGDLNPHNLYPKGVIDFETVFTAPVGYDVITNISHIENFPPGKKYEFPQKYRFTRRQKKYYLETFDSLYRKAGFPSLRENLVYFEFYRDVWSAVRMHKWPNIQKFRYDRFVKKYLN